MTGRHRGCHWNEQQQRWRVVFRVNGKQKQFGQFRTLEEAQNRSAEVWPTLPIAQRAIRTCSSCGKTGKAGKEFHWNKCDCKECGLKRRQVGREALKNRPCKVCGKPLNTMDKRQVVCSKECGHKGRSRTTKIMSCVICGNPLRRYDTTTNAACSITCQRTWAASQQHMDGQDRRWKQHVSQVKQRWYRDRSQERRNANQWVQICVTQRNSVSAAKQTEWKKRCNAAVVCLVSRCEPMIHVTRREKCSKWSGLIAGQMKQMIATIRKNSRDPWDRKVLNAVSSLAKRRRRRKTTRPQMS